MSIDERFIKALHVETLREQDLHAEREPHVIFQTSTIDALLDGAYDGDVTFSQLRDHGDLGLGTFEACDGEMIAVGGEFFRASVDGSVSSVPDSARTPFAVVTFFEPDIRTTVGKSLDQHELFALIDSRLESPPPATRCGSTGVLTTSAPDRCRVSESHIRPWRRWQSSNRSRSSSTLPARSSVSAFPIMRKGSTSPATTCTSSATIGRAAATCSIVAFEVESWQSTTPRSSTSSSRWALMLRRRTRRRGGATCWITSREIPELAN